jgi:hypothetical protein
MSTPTSAVELLDIMARLADILTHETVLLRAGRIGDIAALQSEKLRLLAGCEAAAKARDPASAPPSPSLRAQLAAQNLRLTTAAGENEMALRVGRAATRRLIDMVVESIQAQQSRVCTYGTGRGPARQAPMLPITLDRRA